jgi:toxin YoeB
MDTSKVVYRIVFDDVTKKQLLKLSKNKKLYNRMLVILTDIQDNPYSPAFKFERLKHNLKGFCSKRLDQKNRIVYFVEHEIITVTVVSVLGHY